MSGVMIVTGASRGIGAAIARMASRRGYAVVVNYHQSRTAAEDIVGEIVAGGGRAFAIAADVARSDDAARLFAEVDRLVGPVDVLVNNAGIIGGTMPIEALDGERLAGAFAANVFAAFFCAREAVRRMSRRHGGHGGTIVNLSSAASRHGGLPHEVHYAASKGAIDSFTIALAREVGPCGIRVNAVRPGLIDTMIHAAHGGRATVEALAPTIPLARAGHVDEVAEAVLWLASEGASYIHGAIVDVSGGR